MPGEDPAVLDRHDGALRHVLERRVRRVAEQGDPAVHPVLDRVPVEHLPPPVPPHQRDAPAHGVAGGGEGGVQLVRGPPVFLTGECLWRLEDGDLVEHLAPAQRVLHEVAAGADVDGDVLLRDAVLPDLVDRHGGAVGDVVGADDVVADEFAAGHRVQSVGGDHDGRLLGPPVRQVDPSAAVDVLVVDDRPVRHQLHPGPPAGAQEDAVQVAAVDHHVREAVAALQVPQVEPGQFSGVEGVAHHHVLRNHAEFLGLVEQAVLVQDARAVGGDLEAGADLTELRGPFEHPDPQSLPGEGERGAEAADAATDDDHVGSVTPVTGGGVAKFMFVSS